LVDLLIKKEETLKRVVRYYGAGRMQAEEEVEGRHIIAQEANADVFVLLTAHQEMQALARPVEREQAPTRRETALGSS
jgi:hypothetical protein